MINKILKNKITLLVFLIILLIIGFYLYSLQNEEKSLPALIKNNPIHVFDGYVLEKISASTSLKEQFEVQIISTHDTVTGDVIVSEPANCDLKVDKYSHQFIAVYDQKSKSYDTTPFQNNDYQFNATVLNKIGDKKIGNINFSQYQVKITDNASTLRTLDGTVTLDNLDSRFVLEDGNKYSFIAIRDSVSQEFIIINVGAPATYDYAAYDF